jgi:ATP-binding cassette subfamily B protein
MIRIVKTLMGSIREYKKTSILTPFFVTLEVILECIIPLIMAELINDMTGESMTPIIKYGLILFVMVLFSLHLYCCFIFHLGDYYKLKKLSIWRA